ncbi:hypothetical protein PFICI_06914 [Pestalotiopsis fici W106-1]|uniref:F-box domain-containing protein n=1 Tax=Pestalotiopsis fici (strain W106-1 / CGMCC3.15140) TaxID=1229662 RepID=W3X939_PESFW|nr:uncharacterized protein PFICI_06914 [Pestalotiopsis fici W106-1]ETS81912.1 hypothetical protein PFICI_06914 [Pestalotiopsis fici W106-1]
MEQPSEQVQSELDSFREKWRAEVSARNKKASADSQASTLKASSVASSSSSAGPSRRQYDQNQKRLPTRDDVAHHHDAEDEHVRTMAFDDDPAKGKTVQSSLEHAPAADKEPETALEFYEKAVDKETSGKLGDSLHLYRQAYRLDNRVDRTYREKHFPGVWKKKQQQQPSAGAATHSVGGDTTNPSNAAATVPNTAHHSQESAPVSLSLPDLLASFAGLSLQGAPPAVEGMPPPPCPISELPDEILVHILRDVAVLDVADFVRLSLVCKQFAYLVATENQVWRRVCLGSEFGFGGMVYHWQRGIAWEELDPQLELAEEDIFSMAELSQRRAEDAESTTHELYDAGVYPSWQRMFRQRPRIRFNGCYISTVNYIRTGLASSNHITWNSPVHIVTYYRYLRFFRDGTVISLLTTNEPVDVVHHLTKAHVRQHENKAASHLPSSIMSNALKGRWRLSSSIDNPDIPLAAAEGDLFVETEGAHPKYTYRMELSMKSAGKTKNNKLTWKAFGLYNKLTDDWGDFNLKNDKPFYFSRVKSYGVTGE